ncbi:MAG: hypothetical protein J6N47_02220 [Lachnospiraceae bacterium]|nr:hypothetical protein [Lachnospiraceae bacterium]
MTISREEQETIINYNAAEKIATVYTRDKTVIRRLDALVIEYPEHYRLIGETDIDKTYEMPKSFVSYRKPRKISENRLQEMRKHMRGVNAGKMEKTC